MEKTYVLTGATSGIGKELALLLAARKEKLVLVARNREKLDTLAKELVAQFGIVIETVAVDLSKPDAAERVFAECSRQKLNADVIINNAGMGLYGEHTEIELEKLEEMIVLNVTTITKLCTLFGKEMRKRKQGAILNIASNAAYQPIPYFASYGATKSYVLNFTEALAVELEPHGVRVTCVSPGVTATSFFEKGNIDTDHVFGNEGMDAKQVARFTLDALDRKRFSVMPGLWNNFLAWLPRILPRKLVAHLALFFVKAPNK